MSPLDILERDCPIWSAILHKRIKCYESCAFYESWTVLHEDGVKDDGTCLFFNLRGLNYLIPDEIKEGDE